MGDFKRSPSGSSTLGEKATVERPFISKSPSNSSFGFENTFRVLESQVSQNSTLSGDDDTVLLPNNDPPIVTTLELELGAVARLQQFHYYSTPKNDNKARSSRTTTVNSEIAPARPEDCDRYLEFLNQFIKKSRQKVVVKSEEPRGVPCDKTVSITISGDLDDTEDEPGLVEFGEYPELVYCIAKDKTGRYRLQSKDQRRIKSPQRTTEENSNEGIMIGVGLGGVRVMNNLVKLHYDPPRS